MNTREYRTRKTLEERRHEKIQKLLTLNANYKPPSDYKPPIIRVNDKVMIPQDDHPDINFVGLLIGPRGNTLKTLEKETGAKIIIRGKGSVKEGKIGRKDGQPLPGEDEPLHAYITANDPANVKIAVARIHEIIKEGIEVPEEKNDLRKQQLRELALLNGTLRDNDSGLQKLRQIAEAETIITNQIICNKCGAAGHIARDCVQRPPAELTQSQMVASGGVDSLPANTIVGRQDRAKMDSEYMSLMAELGQVAPETLKSEFSKMAQPLPGDSSNGNSNFGSLNKTSDQQSSHSSSNNSASPLAVTSDYGYGGRRSRFDEFENSRNRNDRFGNWPAGPRFDGQICNQNQNRFPQGNPQQRFSPAGFNQSPGSRFNQGPGRFPSNFNPGHVQSGFNPRPSGFDQAPGRFDQGAPLARFDQRPPGGNEGWSNDSTPNHGMMNSNRWGSSTAAPPPPQNAPPGAPPMPPSLPPASSGSWSQPTTNNPPWQQQSNAPAPPWQNQSNFRANPPAPPPPPGSFSGPPGYNNYGTGGMPPPPPPQ
ncbi:splicing factor 1-like isoform X2 [Watersipora subatra]